MSRSRKPLSTETLFRSKEEIEKEERESTSGDMSQDNGERPIKRASFDVYADQIQRLGQLKYTSGKRIQDLVREALDEYLAKHG